MNNKTRRSQRTVFFLLVFLMFLPVIAYGKREMYARLNTADSTLTLYYDENRQEGDYGVNKFDYGYYLPDWNSGDGCEERRKIIKAVVFDPSFKDARPTSCRGWFYLCSNLERIQGMENFNTSEVVDMELMFHGCKKLTTIDLSHFNTGKVTDMYNMFGNCNGIESLDVSSFDTRNVTMFANMFYGCSGLTSLDLASFDTGKATNMSYMFNSCTNLRSIDLSSFNTDNVSDMTGMFSKCKNLEELDLSSFNVERVEEMGAMFSDCYNLTMINLSSFNTKNLKSMACMFAGCKSLVSLDLSSLNTEKVDNLQSLFLDCTSLLMADLSNFNTASLKDTRYMFQNCTSLTCVDLSSFVTDKLIDMGNMFTNCQKLQTIYASSAFTTDSLNEEYGAHDAFKGCVSLPNYDESKTGKELAHIGEGGYFTVAPTWVCFDEATGTLTFQCSNARGKAETSYDLNDRLTDPGWNSKASEIKKVVFTSSFRDANPSTCSTWFKDCSNLSQIDGLENLNTSEATSMEAMFYGCEKLTSLDLSKFNTGSVTNMNKMFSGCANLSTLNLSGFNTEKVTGMQDMFLNCSQLTTLDLSSFKGKELTTTDGMFNGCSNLASVNLSHFETSNNKLKHLDKMFRFCSALTVLDLSKFSITNATGNQLFDNCSNLNTVYVGDSFDLEEGNKMFSECEQLCGAVSFDSGKTGKEQANYVSGYFTKKVGMNGEEIIGAVGNPLVVEELQLDDNKAFKLNEPCQVINVSYMRKMPAEWATLCLPYSVNVASNENNCLFYAMSKVDGNSVTLELLENGQIAAGYPVIIRKKDKTQEEVYIKHINSYFGIPLVIAPMTGDTDGIRMKGTFESILAPGGGYILQTDGMFHRVDDGNTELKVGAYRAWLDLGGAADGAKAISLTFDDHTSGIKDVNTTDGEPADGQIYDLMGRRISKPRRGQIYIKRTTKRRQLASDLMPL